MELQTLSNRLHYSKLEYLGLEAAAASFCRELSDQKKVEIPVCFGGDYERSSSGGRA